MTLFKTGIFGDALLLGDGAYPVQSYLITPLCNTETRAQELYYESLIRTRNIIERVFGIWKRRFPILALGSRFSKVQRVLPVIVATAILHNIARRAGDPIPPDDPLQLPVPWVEILEKGNIPLMNDTSGNNHMQNILINDYFRSLL